MERLQLPADFAPSWIQARILRDDTRVVVACCGRRVGKTWIGAYKTAKLVHTRMAALVQDVREGKRKRHISEGRPARIARYLRPDILAWIVAPAERHLDEARGYLLQLYAEPGWEDYLHPAFPGGIYDRGHQLWLLRDGVCARYDFIPASSEGRLVGKGLDILWIDEAGFIDNARYQAIKPATMDKRADILATGTPDLGDDHWFTKLAIAGLPDGHERSDPMVEHNPEVSTWIADTVRHAALAEARSEAVKEAKFWGSRWAARWIYADWRMRGRHVYDEWNADKHVKRYGLRGAAIWLGNERLPRPDTVIGAVDWSGGAAPGAAVVAHVWRRNPLSQEDPRPLVVVVADHQGYEAYTDDGWWAILRGLDRRWGVDRWVGDPHAPNLIQQANDAGIWVEPGEAADKMGRIHMVGSLLHWSEGEGDEAGVAPALYVSSRCEHTMQQFGEYAWKTSRDGEILDKPRQYNDHCMDCMAMIAPEIGEGTAWIGTEAYG